jgi:hypothetical protein
MLFSNPLVAIGLTVLFPLGLMGLLAAGEWLERRTLAAEEVVPRRLRRMATQPPEAVEAMVLEETAHVVAQYWSATGRQVPPPSPNGGQPTSGPAPSPPAGSPLPGPFARAAGRSGNGSGGRHLRRPASGRAGRHERRR